MADDRAVCGGNVLIVEAPPSHALADEAQAMLDDALASLHSARSDRERYYWCAVVAACEQAAWALLSIDGVDCCQPRSPVRVSMDYFGRLVSAR